MATDTVELVNAVPANHTANLKQIDSLSVSNDSSHEFQQETINANDKNNTHEPQSRAVATSNISAPVFVDDSDKDDDDRPPAIHTRHLSDSLGMSAITASPSNVGNVSTAFPSIMQYRIKHKWRKFLTNPIFCGRIFTLILTILLLVLSIIYCIAQLLFVRLELFNICEEQKTPQQIWKHSYEAGLDDGKVVMNEESQYGHTDEPCWTTNQFDTNTGQLWYSNKYVYLPKNDTNTAFALFLVIALFCALVIVYDLIMIIMDIYWVANNKLHEKSKGYKRFIKKQQQKQPKVDGCLQRMITRISTFWRLNIGTDTTFWIIRSIISECLEFCIQSIALLLYNGYTFSIDENNVPLANKPEYIIGFAMIISFNAFGSGIVWLSYSLAHGKCHGLVFKLSIFFIDQASDLLYTIFPFIILLTDDYNQNTDTLLILGQLNIDSPTAFITKIKTVCCGVLGYWYIGVLRMQNTKY